jgi:hypothetical protein
MLEGPLTLCKGRSVGRRHLIVGCSGDGEVYILEWDKVWSLTLIADFYLIGGAHPGLSRFSAISSLGSDYSSGCRACIHSHARAIK